MKQWQIEKAREICRARKIRYQIKYYGGHTDRLYLYSRITGHFVQVCYDLLNFKTIDELAACIIHAEKLYMC